LLDFGFWSLQPKQNPRDRSPKIQNPKSKIKKSKIV
jgi:hypothetical protein